MKTARIGDRRSSFCLFVKRDPADGEPRPLATAGDPGLYLFGAVNPLGAEERAVDREFDNAMGRDRL
jgi:hypothetical protein